ncbi:hypothetical protein QCA50_015287 [Cerrena zonata]|uniref:Uncharacterized protein n=1 Tax=Cerrena zonata TaxID=2478898 RepID=A0AAW0FJD9_9APHY
MALTTQHTDPLSPSMALTTQHTDPPVIDALVKLRQLVYIGGEAVLKSALKVLEAVDESSRIRSISLLISGDSEADDWEQLDHILTDVKFKSLESVSTYNIHTSFLAELHSRDIATSIEPDETRSMGIVRINSWRKEMRDEQESSKDREGDSNEWFYDPDSEMVDTEVS